MRRRFVGRLRRVSIDSRSLGADLDFTAPREPLFDFGRDEHLLFHVENLSFHAVKQVLEETADIATFFFGFRFFKSNQELLNIQ